MTREEIKNELFDIILKNSSPTMEIKRTIDYQQTMVIVEELIKHETDLLKEFVIYLQSTGKYQAIDEYIDSMGISWGKRYMSANHQLNQDLEKFLEERK